MMYLTLQTHTSATLGINLRSHTAPPHTPILIFGVVLLWSQPDPCTVIPLDFESLLRKIERFMLRKEWVVLFGNYHLKDITRI